MCVIYAHMYVCLHTCVSKRPEGTSDTLLCHSLPCSPVTVSPRTWSQAGTASPKCFPVPHTSGVMGKWEQHPAFVSLILMFELRSSCLQLLFFYFDPGLANFYYSCFGGWMVCVQLLSSSTSSIWTQPLTTDKWLGLYTIIFYFQTPIFGF